MCDVFSLDYIETAIGRRSMITGLFEFDVLTPSGPCENIQFRSELPYRLTPRNPANTNPPILLAGNRNPALNFQPPYCIAFTASLPSENLGTLFVATELRFHVPAAVSLRVSASRIEFESGGQSVTFNPPGGAASFVESNGGYVHLQLCVTTSNQAQLYTDCGDQPLTKNFTSSQQLNNTIIIFFQNETTGGNIFSVCNNMFACANNVYNTIKSPVIHRHYLESLYQSV